MEVENDDEKLYMSDFGIIREGTCMYVHTCTTKLQEKY